MPSPDPSQRLREAGRVGVFALVSMGLLGVIAAVGELPFLFPSLGPTAFLIAGRPSASAASPRNTVVGHTVGAMCGLAAVVLCGLSGAPDALSGGMVPMRIVAAALALGSTGALLVLIDRRHPPAGATTLIVALGLMGAMDVVTLLVAVVLLVALGVGFARAVGSPLPVWAPRKALP